MKKNLKKVDMPKQKKPKIGKRYKIWLEDGCSMHNTMLILDIVGDYAVYAVNEDGYKHEWDYVRFPEFLNYELSSLEEELL